MSSTAFVHASGAGGFSSMLTVGSGGSSDSTDATVSGGTRSSASKLSLGSSSSTTRAVTSGGASGTTRLTATGGGSNARAATGGMATTGGQSSSASAQKGDLVCDLPAPSAFSSNSKLGGGGTQYKESDHFIVFGASNPDAVLRMLEAAHQCFVEDWCWRSTGLSITSNSGTYFKTNVYSKPSLGAGGYMQYDATAGLSYLEILASQIGLAQVTVHEYGHALTLAAKGWVDQTNTGFWWESVANFVADTFITSSYCESARSNFGIPAGNTIIELDRVYGLPHTVICNDQNYYQAWPFLTYLTNNPDNYPGLGRMVLPDMFRLHKGNNETPLHVLARIASPVTVQTILGRYWARMAYLDIGHPKAQQAFLSGRQRLNFAANLDSASGQMFKVKANRQPQYGGANINPLRVTGDGAINVRVTNLGNGLQESNFTATLAIRAEMGDVRYVDLPGGSGETQVASGEEVSLVVVNTPDTVYMYNPERVGSPENVGLNYEVQLIGAVPSS
ncbi:MAG: DUF6055 domain-containing protein [Myxococcales bacterium]